jgi:hypothetical protein
VPSPLARTRRKRAARYAQVMNRAEGERNRLRALIEGEPFGAVPARFGADRAPETSEQEAVMRHERRTARHSGASGGWARVVSNHRPLACEAQRARSVRGRVFPVVAAV